MQSHSDRPDIDFHTLLTRGAATYDSAVGHWWHQRSLDNAHRKAYAHIAQLSRGLCEVRQSIPSTILDYACGNGAFLGELRRVFPSATLIGIDGSEQLLQACVQAHGQECSLLPAKHLFTHTRSPVRLCQSVLPNFKLPAGKADLAFLVFPNLVPDEAHLNVFNQNGYSNLADNHIARMLARFREMDPEDETNTLTADELFDHLMTQRVYARNLRKVLRKGGVLVRVEYSQAPRNELSALTQWRHLFSEGALDQPLKGSRSQVFFRYLGSEFQKSKVILDVYHQTGNPDDKRGGYMVSLYEAC